MDELKGENFHEKRGAAAAAATACRSSGRKRSKDVSWANAAAACDPHGGFSFKGLFKTTSFALTVKQEKPSK